MKKILQTISLALGLMLVTGVLFPLVLTGVAQVIFPHQANGSLVMVDDVPVGSELIGQDFQQDLRYLQTRPSANDYNMMGENTPSGSHNYSPSDPRLPMRIEATLTQILAENPGLKRDDVPTDLLLESASGLDPHISVAAATMQMVRIVSLTDLTPQELQMMIDEHTQAGHVNVLMVNLDIYQALKGQ